MVLLKKKEFGFLSIANLYLSTLAFLIVIFLTSWIKCSAVYIFNVFFLVKVLLLAHIVPFQSNWSRVDLKSSAPKVAR